MKEPLPQEFPRDLALLTLEDALPDLGPGARAAYTAAFERLRDHPLPFRGLVLAGPGGLRPLMALMRLVVLRLRELNLERFPGQGGTGRLLSAYIQGRNLSRPLPDRMAVLFVERLDQVDPALATELELLRVPVLGTWEGPEEGRVWVALQTQCDILRLGL